MNRSFILYFDLFINRNVVRDTRANRLQSVDNSSSDEVFLGKQGKDFAFAHLSQDIQIIECSAKQREFDSFTNWIKQLS